MISYPELSPFFLQIGPISLRWYGLSYILGFVFGGMLMAKPLKQRFGFTTDDIFNLISSVIIGILLGGRLGYILFYDLSFYAHNPFEILAVWHGGMSFHGGVIGAVLALFLFCRSLKRPFLSVLDVLTAVSPVGLGLGRLANFVNGELYGRVSTVSWAMIFPNGGPLPRHPSQLYEAFFEGLILFVILYPLMLKFKSTRGEIFAAGLLGYGLIRFFIEFVREPDAQLGFLWLNLTMGQWLCLAMMGSGVLVLSILTYQKKHGERI